MTFLCSLSSLVTSSSYLLSPREGNRLSSHSNAMHGKHASSTPSHLRKYLDRRMTVRTCPGFGQRQRLNVRRVCSIIERATSRLHHALRCRILSCALPPNHIE